MQTCPLARVFAFHLGQDSAVDPLPVLLLGQEDPVKSNVYGHSRVVWRRARAGVVKKPNRRRYHRNLHQGNHRRAKRACNYQW